ncbi:hypothetical protein V6R21_14140 [Limibacter armeniacum]|uniref:hypothetical protein n=1 Tax=Limibacter armeniacum TaxID=466084 RepID=UPI002FE5B2DB
MKVKLLSLLLILSGAASFFSGTYHVFEHVRIHQKSHETHENFRHFLWKFTYASKFRINRNQMQSHLSNTQIEALEVLNRKLAVQEASGSPYIYEKDTELKKEKVISDGRFSWQFRLEDNKWYMTKCITETP